MSAIGTFPPAIRRYLSDHVARSRRAAILRAGLVACAWAIALLLAACLADRLIGLPPWVRVALLVVNIAGVAWLLTPPVAHWLRRDVDWIQASQEIEGRDRSLGQRLITVVSQLLSPARYRGSEQILRRLVDEVTAEVSATPRRRAPGAARGAVARPLAIVALVAGLGAAMWPVEWFNMPRLLHRQLAPLAPLPPVTTTQIEVACAVGSGASWTDADGVAIDLRERESVVVRVTVRRLGDDGAPVLHSSQGAAGEWVRTPMIPGLENTWTLTLSGLDQDLRFFIRAGDARTRPTHLRLLRKPAVAEFRVRYNYPAYTGRAALATHNTDGLLEAPQQTEATLTVVATEPLASATLLLKGDNKRIDLTPTDQPNARQARIIVSRDQPLELDLVSERGVRGTGPAGMLMRGVPDRPPLVRMIQPTTDLRLAPRDVLLLSAQALDDYGVASVTAIVQVNPQAPVESPLAIKGDARRVEESLEVDLAKLSVKVGDVVSFGLRATDRAGQTSRTEIRHVLISPRSVDVAAHERLGELSQAYDLARDWSDGLDKAQDYLERARRVRAGRDAELASAVSRVGRQLAAAQESASLLKQSLLRAVMRSAGPQMSDALAVLLDQLATQSDYAERVDHALMSRRPVEDQAVSRLTRSVAGAKAMTQQIKAMADGEQAAAVLADRGNLRDGASKVSATNPADRAAADRRRQMVDRARQDVAAALEALKINPNQKDAAIDAQLQARVEAARRAIAEARAIDLVGPANKWSAAIKSRETLPPKLDERLYIAAQAEAVRPDSDAVAARDFTLAARAVSNLAERAAARDSEPAAAEKPAALPADLVTAADQLPQALAALRAEHEINRRALGAKNLAEARKVIESGNPQRAAASQARAKMLAWAAGPSAKPDEIAAKAKELEEMALAASAATATRNFEDAAKLDQKLASATSRPDIAHAADAPRTIDSLSQNQETLANQTESADDRQAAAIAGAQKKVADDLAGGGSVGGSVDPLAPARMSAAEAGDSRQRATAAIAAAQERLASLPMALSTAESMAEAVADVSARLAKARTDAAGVPAGAAAEREAADRVVAQLGAEMEEAGAAFAQARKAVADRLAQELADSLRPFAPETTAATAAIDEQLRPALVELQKALDAGKSAGEENAAAVATAAGHTRSAIQEVQDALRDAQARVIERDPLVSARWFARAAADALSAAPPRKGAAAAHQRSTLEALGKAGIDAQRRGRNLRLSQVPSFSQLYLPPAAPAWGDSTSGTARPSDRLMQGIPGLREWGRLRDRLGDPLAAPTRDSDPPGFSESLRLYFDVLGREESKAREGK